MADTSLAQLERSGIYEIVNTVNGKRYIGSAVKLALRWRQHRCELRKGRHNPHFQSAWKKYGESAFVFTVLEYVDDISALIGREQFYINSVKPEYNCAPIAGSRLGTKAGEETKRRISEASLRVWAQPGYREKMSNLHKGKTLPDEQKAKIGYAHRGRKLPPERAAALAKANQIRTQSAEHCAKMSAYWKGRAKTPEQIAKMAATKRGRPLTADHRIKLAETMRLAHAEGRHNYERTEELRNAIGRSLAKFADDQIHQIREKRRNGAKVKDLCAEYGISQAAMSNICNGKTYCWVKN